jgi:RNA polymerase sigma-70 factor (ECF subfamily)
MHSEQGCIFPAQNKKFSKKPVTPPAVLLSIRVKELNPMDDDKIIALYHERSEQAISQTAAKYGKYCAKIAYNILHSREDSEECVNDTWLKAWNSMPPSAPKILSAFLGKITRNLSVNRVLHDNARKRGSGEFFLALDELSECIPSENSAEAAFEEKALCELISRFLAAQTAENRRIFMQRYWYLFSVKKIAEHYSLSESAVKMRLLRMREELREILIKEGYTV